MVVVQPGRFCGWHPNSASKVEWAMVVAAAVRARVVPSRAADVGLQSGLLTTADPARVIIHGLHRSFVSKAGWATVAAAVVRAHVVPSHGAGVDLQSGLPMTAGPVQVALYGSHRSFVSKVGWEASEPTVIFEPHIRRNIC